MHSLYMLSLRALLSEPEVAMTANIRLLPIVHSLVILEHSFRIKRLWTFGAFMVSNLFVELFNVTFEASFGGVPYVLWEAQRALERLHDPMDRVHVTPPTL